MAGETLGFQPANLNDFDSAIADTLQSVPTVICMQ